MSEEEKARKKAAEKKAAKKKEAEKEAADDEPDKKSKNIGNLEDLERLMEYGAKLADREKLLQEEEEKAKAKAEAEAEAAHA